MHMPSRIAGPLLSLILPLMAVISTVPAAAAEYNPVAREPRSTDSTPSLAVIVKLRKNATGAALMKMGGAGRTSALSKRTGLSLTLKREISDSMQANLVDLKGASLEQALAALRGDPAVEYVSVDHLRHPHATSPNDSLFSGQWYL